MIAESAIIEPMKSERTQARSLVVLTVPTSLPSFPSLLFDPAKKQRWAVNVKQRSYVDVVLEFIWAWSNNQL
jgi:hypothetical protein